MPGPAAAAFATTAAAIAAAATAAAAGVLAQNYQGRMSSHFYYPQFPGAPAVNPPRPAYYSPNQFHQNGYHYNQTVYPQYAFQPPQQPQPQQPPPQQQQQQQPQQNQQQPQAQFPGVAPVLSEEDMINGLATLRLIFPTVDEEAARVVLSHYGTVNAAAEYLADSIAMMPNISQAQAVDASSQPTSSARAMTGPPTLAELLALYPNTASAVNPSGLAEIAREVNSSRPSNLSSTRVAGVNEPVGWQAAFPGGGEPLHVPAPDLEQASGSASVAVAAVAVPSVTVASDPVVLTQLNWSTAPQGVAVQDMNAFASSGDSLADVDEDEIVTSSRRRLPPVIYAPFPATAVATSTSANSTLSTSGTTSAGVTTAAVLVECGSDLKLQQRELPGKASVSATVEASTLVAASCSSPVQILEHGQSTSKDGEKEAESSEAAVVEDDAENNRILEEFVQTSKSPLSAGEGDSSSPGVSTPYSHQLELDSSELEELESKRQEAKEEKAQLAQRLATCRELRFKVAAAEQELAVTQATMTFADSEGGPLAQSRKELEALRLSLSSVRERNEQQVCDLKAERAILLDELSDLRVRARQGAQVREEANNSLAELETALNARLMVCRVRKEAVEAASKAKEAAVKCAIDSVSAEITLARQEEAALEQMRQMFNDMQKRLEDHSASFDCMMGEVAVIQEDVTALLIEAQGEVPLSQSSSMSAARRAFELKEWVKVLPQDEPVISVSTTLSGTEAGVSGPSALARSASLFASAVEQEEEAKKSGAAVSSQMSAVDGKASVQSDGLKTPSAASLLREGSEAALSGKVDEAAALFLSGSQDEEEPEWLKLESYRDIGRSSSSGSDSGERKSTTN